jgi:2-polyprenyl-3-methyl-5-hydroxy-6-metoxy-1,4-benzoquinol methylase
MMDVIERIAQLKHSEPFDFRTFACPEDRLSYLFDEWVDYYHTKYALCRALDPGSILEIGVRYGYSAISFLTACPRARYLGIDNDSETYGGAGGAMAWARRITSGYAAEFRVADTQSLSALPGDRWDLVHIDGQQDGDGTFRDLELALRKATWILLDGYFHSTVNLLSATYFLEKYKLLIDGAYVIPGYAGELLMKVRAGQAPSTPDDRRLHSAYDGPYYCTDCGGYDAFKRTGGRLLLDETRRALYCLARPASGTKVLDVGSGRGEFVFACFAAGADVVGVDYSEAAIDIASRTYGSDVGPRLRFVRADILDYEADTALDAITMADFVEHVAPERLDRVIRRCREWLKADGHLLIHTWPNRFIYEYRHRRRRRLAAAAGLYVPRNPRTYYEDVLHINEQTPARLRKVLQTHFAHVIVWRASRSDALGTLRDGVAKRDMATFESIYAIASVTPIDPAFVRAALTQPALLPASVNGVRVDLLAVERSARCGCRITAKVRVSNRSACRLASLGPFPVHCAYHWTSGERAVVFDGLRTALWPPLASGDTQVVEMEIDTPSEPGRYELVITIVQEENFWFDAAIPGCVARASIEVR